MLSNKDVEVLRYLLAEETCIPLKQLADHFSVSERSIRYYISNIHKELHKDYIQIVKGVCHIKDHQELRQYLSAHQPTLYTSDIRKKIVFYHLIFSGSINITAISNELEISRSSGKAYLEEARQFLIGYHLELRQEYKKGLVLCGSEENIRKVQLHAFMEFDRLSATSQSILSPILKDYQDGIDDQRIHTFLAELQKLMSFVLSDHSYFIMHKACMIVLRRTRDGFTMESCENEYFLVTCQEYQAIKDTYSLLDKTLNHYEILYITSLLIGSHYAKNTNLSENNWFEHDLLVSKIINLYSKYYQVNLNQDRTLYESLLTHLRPTMYRLLNNIPVPEMDHEEIKQHFPKEYEITRNVLQELNFFTSEEQDCNEIALLTLHFKAAINRCEQPVSSKKNVLIICSHGYGTSKLLEQQLSELYEVNVLDCLPFHYLSQYEPIDQVDFIITTIHELASFHDLPILHVSPLLNQDDITKLDKSLLARRKNKISMGLLLDAIKKSCTIHELGELKQDLQNVIGDLLIRDDGKDQTLLDILPEKNILLNYPANDWQSAIRKAGALLVENGYVNERYQEQMLNSFENYGSYMIIDDGIAIPHAKNDGCVYQTGMTLVVLDHPVTFLNGKKLQVFFSFCSKDNIEHLDALVAVANLIKETDFKHSLSSFKTPRDVLNFIIMQKL